MAKSKVRAEGRESLSADPFVVFGATMLAAAIVYFFRIGADALGASEAYSAWAAAMPSIRSIVQIPVLEDPGKQVFYYALLHYFSSIFGMSEASLRSFSAITALASIAMLFAAGRAMFGETTGATAAILWAFNPIVILLARRARMYPMFAAIAVAHLVLLWEVRRRPNWLRIAGCALTGAAMIYTHLAGLAIAGAEAAMLIRDAWRGRWQAGPWIALAIALGLFAPYLPIFMAQSRTLLYGHWLDWISAGHHYGVIEKGAAGAVATAIGIALVFGPGFESDRDEPLRWCIAWAILPAAAFVAGSIIIRPMLHVRYLMPCLAIAALIAAALLNLMDSRRRNLAAAGLVMALLVLIPYLQTPPQPWRYAAIQVAESSPGDPVFFESGFVSSGKSLRIPNGGFPEGYYRVPFEYYFRGPNPRIAIPGFDPDASRNTIAASVAKAGGGWLMTWKDEADARAELPGGFRIVEKLRQPEFALYRIEAAR